MMRTGDRQTNGYDDLGQLLFGHLDLTLRVHFRHDGGRWIATRDGAELYDMLSRLVSEQSGAPVRVTGT